MRSKKLNEPVAKRKSEGLRKLASASAHAMKSGTVRTVSVAKK